MNQNDWERVIFALCLSCVSACLLFLAYQMKLAEIHNFELLAQFKRELVFEMNRTKDIDLCLTLVFGGIGYLIAVLRGHGGANSVVEATLLDWVQGVISHLSLCDILFFTLIAIVSLIMLCALYGVLCGVVPTSVRVTLARAFLYGLLCFLFVLLPNILFQGCVAFCTGSPEVPEPPVAPTGSPEVPVVDPPASPTGTQGTTSTASQHWVDTNSLDVINPFTPSSPTPSLEAVTSHEVPAAPVAVAPVAPATVAPTAVAPTAVAPVAPTAVAPVAPAAVAPVAPPVLSPEDLAAQAHFRSAVLMAIAAGALCVVAPGGVDELATVGLGTLKIAYSNAITMIKISAKTAWKATFGALYTLNDTGQEAIGTVRQVGEDTSVAIREVGQETAAMVEQIVQEAVAELREVMYEGINYAGAVGAGLLTYNFGLNNWRDLLRAASRFRR